MAGEVRGGYILAMPLAGGDDDGIITRSLRGYLSGCIKKQETTNKKKKKEKKKNSDKRGIRTPASFLTRIRSRLSERRLNLSLAP
jgi:uncharacterized protein (DUF1015 family)